MTPGGPATAAWVRLHQAARGCRACPLHATRTQAVFYRGAARPTVLFIGEAPGADEDRAGVPFVGRAGQRLDAAVRELGLPEDAYGVANLLKCHPPSNRFPSASIAPCRPFLQEQISLLDPPWIVTLGRHALHALDPGAPPISEAAGHERRCAGRRLFPLLHPAAALHDPRRRSKWEADLVALRSLLPRSAETL